ncbi:MauE/DoxX family redox-associated membrane protein [Sphaerimonospora sp. CA-214678]|uniref:MauE/DoxX family redox-associated membrane protein n=1 Tax=Sphaerimonospora sp. CA-214678 TaxID=3240029 RepID=UPI003D90162D
MTEQLAIAARCLIGVVFVLSAAGKLRSGTAFAEFARSGRALTGALLGGRPIGRAAGLWVGAAVVAAEVAVVALLAVTATARAGFALAVVLLLGFTAGLLAEMRRGTRTPCRCFGASSTPIGRRHIVRNAALIALSLAGFTAAFAAGQSPLPHPAAVAAGAVLALVVARLDDLVELFAS